MKKIFILMGPSGSGKTTLARHLGEKNIPELISHTTRPKREKEIHGIDYYFVNKDEWDQIEKIESAEYAGNYYCLSKQEVDEKFKLSNTVFIIAEKHGAEQIIDKFPGAAEVIFITIPLKEMERRMRARGDTEEQIKKRLNNAVKNNEHDDHGLSSYHIENFDLDLSKQIIEEIILAWD